jgi:hypothetical protein
MSPATGRRRTMRLCTLLILLALLLMWPAAIVAKAESFTASVKIPIDIVVFVPCANGGAGENVALSGTLHDLFHITLDGNGGFHSKFHVNPQGVSGIGETTGTKYQGTGVTQGTFNGQVGFETSFVNNFRIIGQGPGNNFLVHENFHVTINANGTVTAFVDNFRVECK